MHVICTARLKTQLLYFGLKGCLTLSWTRKGNKSGHKNLQSELHGCNADAISHACVFVCFPADFFDWLLRNMSMRICLHNFADEYESRIVCDGGVPHCA